LQEASKSEAQKRDERINSLEKELIAERKRLRPRAEGSRLTVGYTPEKAWQTNSTVVAQRLAARTSKPKPADIVGEPETGATVLIADGRASSAAAIRAMRRQ
jgi:hypothetical protein